MLSQQEFNLHYAAKEGDIDKAALLLKAGVNPNCLDDNTTPLFLAISHNHYQVVKLLCENKADINYQNSDGYNALITAILFSRKPALIHYLLEKGARFSNDISNNLFKFVWENDEDSLKKNSLSFDVKDSLGNTLVHYAVLANRLNILKWLIQEKKLNPSLKNNPGNAALHYAAMHGNFDILKWLIEEAKVSVNEEGRFNQTILHQISFIGKKDILQFLLEREEIKTNAKDSSRNTPECFAIYGGHLSCLKLLLKFNKNCHEEGAKGNSLLHHAVFANQFEILAWLLKERKVDLCVKNDDGFTAFQLAVNIENSLMVSLLLDYGAGIYADCSSLKLEKFDLTNKVLIAAHSNNQPLKIAKAINTAKELQIAIQEGTAFNLPYLRQRVLAYFKDNPKNDELKKTKVIIESFSNLKNRCLFFCADSFDKKDPSLMQLTQELQIELNNYRNLST